MLDLKCDYIFEMDITCMKKPAIDLLKKDCKNYYKQVLVAIAVFLVFDFLFDNFCPLLLCTGIPCPACGLTRASILLLSGHFYDAFFMHPLIYPILVFLVYFIIMRYGLSRKVSYAKGILAALILIGLLLYAYRMIHYFPGNAPMQYEPVNMARFLLKYSS